MTPTDLDQIWKDTETTLLPNPEEALGIVRRERRREKTREALTVVSGINLSVATLAVAWGLYQGRIPIGEAWPACFVLLLFWGSYLEMFRFRSSNDGRFPDKTVREVLESTLRRARASLRDTKILLVLNLAAVVPMMVVSVQSLSAAGKMSAGEALSFSLFAGTVLAANIGFLAYNALGRLLPRTRLLRAQLASLDA
ncbi:hypothetical protein BH23VER1_BH23VER1_17570 [soil metagenome]